jgi:hypothetical protein
MNATTIARLIAAAAVFAAAAAQADTPRSRADVKAETLAAMKAGTIISGEGTPTPLFAVASTKTRAERKAETLVARSKDELVHSGLSTYRASISQQTATAHSTKTRAERKGETMDAIRNKQVMQPGEAA